MTFPPQTDLPVALGSFSSREQIASTVEALIDMLDRLDPDPDLEVDDFDMCPAADDAGTGPHWCNQGDGLVGDPDDGEDGDGDYGLEEQGEPDDDNFFYPIYGIDQSRFLGPISEFCDLNDVSVEDLLVHHPIVPTRRNRPILRPRYGGAR